MWEGIRGGFWWVEVYGPACRQRALRTACIYGCAWVDWSLNPAVSETAATGCSDPLLANCLANDGTGGYCSPRVPLLAWKKPFWRDYMAYEILTPIATEEARIELKSYNTTIPMGSLAIGVDNIHHDVFLSPKFVQASRDYLFDLIRQSTKATYFSGIELRTVKAPDNAAYRKLLTDLLQSALTQAKYQKNIEIDLLFRLALLKFLTLEIGNQFANLILEGKEWIRQRGEHFERSQQAHVIKSRLSELQSSRRVVVRGVGQQIAQMVADAEDNVVSKARRALFGEDFAAYYELLKNRLVFLDGGKDDVFFLEHYVLLGNYVRDPDRFEAMDELFQDFLRDAGLAISQDSAYTDASQSHRTLMEAAQGMRNEIANLEEQRESLQKTARARRQLLEQVLEFRRSLGFESVAERCGSPVEASGSEAGGNRAPN